MSKKHKLAFVTFLTFVRFPLVLLFFAGAIVHSYYPLAWLFWITFLALVLSALTDLFDGYYARKFGVVTTFGAHVDPLMDKFFYLASLPLLVYIMALNPQHHHLASAMLLLTLIFLARDQWVTFLRSIGSMYQADGKANWSGKLRTALNFPMICIVYYVMEAPAPFNRLIHPSIAYAFVALTLVLTIMTLFIYTRQYWPYLRRSAQINSDSV
ncbi:MAG: CDP-alcohol phosphatidyltransferase family protein [Kiritimatiellia bacterium]